MTPFLLKLPMPAAFVASLLSFHLLFTILGLGATLILIPERLSRYALVFSPVVGLCIVSWLGWQSLSLEFAGTNASAAIICLLCCSLLIVSLARADNAAASVMLNREMLLVFAIALCGAMALSIPAMVEPHLTTISAGNNDFASYALIERFLMSHAIDAQPGNLRQYLDVPGVAQTVFAPYFGSALAGSVLRLESHQLENVGLGVFALWGSMVFFVIARELFRFRQLPAALLLGAFSVNETVVYLTAQGFKSQVAAMSIAGSIYCWILPAVARGDRATGREIAGTAVLTWGLVASYPHMIPPVALPIVFCCGLLAFRARSLHPLSRGAAYGLLIVGATLALSPSKAAGAYRWAADLKDVSAGWFVSWASPAAFLGLTGTSSFSHLRWPIEVLLGCAFVAMVAAGLILARRREDNAFLFAVSFLVVIATAYVFLVIKGRESSGLGGYKAFKLLSFFAPLVWCSALLVLREPHTDVRARWVQGVLAVALLGGNLSAGGKLINSVRATHSSVGPELAELSKLESDSRISSLNLITSNFWDGMWEATFLFHKNLSATHQTYYPARPALGDWTLVEHNPDPILHVETCRTADAVRVNDRFEAVHGSPDRAEWDAGWEGDEHTHRWTNEQVASIRFHSRPREPIRVSLRYSLLDPADHLTVRLNGLAIAACSDGNRCVFEAETAAIDNVLTFAGSIMPHPPGGGDSRKLGISFSEIRIAERGCTAQSGEAASHDGSGRSPAR